MVTVFPGWSEKFPLLSFPGTFRTLSLVLVQDQAEVSRKASLSLSSDVVVVGRASTDESFPACPVHASFATYVVNFHRPALRLATAHTHQATQKLPSVKMAMDGVGCVVW